MSTRMKIVLALGLLLLPFAVRFIWFNSGSYTPPDSLNDVAISLTGEDRQAYDDQPTAGDGLVLIDAAHGNNLAVDDLSPMRDRLAARGVTLAIDDGSAGLASQLRTATAYVVLAPTAPFFPEERAVIADFVAAGGRLLIAADPTRQVPVPDDEFITLFDIFFPESAIPSVNSLAGQFGVAFYDDYLYNLNSTDGNYRNVRYVINGAGHSVVSGLEQVVFFAGHSLRGGEPLFLGGESVQSNTRTGETLLAPAVSAEQGQVILLGDLSAITAPYHTIADNDRLLSNLADWLSSSERAWGIEDFPLNFTGPVEFTALDDSDPIDPRLLTYVGSLQGLFDSHQIGLSIGQDISTTEDVMLVGSFESAARVSGILAGAGISVTTSSESTEEPSDETATPVQTIHVADLGRVDSQGSTLFVLDLSGSQTRLVVLAEDLPAQLSGLDMLVSGFAPECLQTAVYVLCSTGDVAEADPGQDGGGTGGGEGDGEAIGEDTGAVPAIEPTGKSIFVFSDDDGPNGNRTSASEWVAALTPAYDVTLWTASLDGIPTEDDLIGFDAVIVTSGDYAFDEDDTDTFLVFIFLENTPLFFIGAQPFPGFGEDTAAINDLTLSAPDHALGQGLPTEIILLPSDSGVSAQILPQEDLSEAPEDSEFVMLFTRGAGSPESGLPAMLLSGTPDGKFAYAVFAFYRLPAELQQTLALNLAAWLTAD